MRILVLVALLVTSTCWAQEPASNPQQPPSQAQALPPAASQKQTIVIPAGTRIPAQLASPVTTKLGRPGDSVRAVTTFPVTVDTELAIPAGSYIEGVIDKIRVQFLNSGRARSEQAGRASVAAAGRLLAACVPVRCPYTHS